MDSSGVILAIASPPGRSLRGIVRASGAACFDLLEAHVRPFPDRGSRRARLTFDDLDLPAIVLAFPGPRSYTGEDSAEVQLPGNPILLDRAIDALIRSGRSRGLEARRAAAGEFTARAFFNGRLSLTEAEGVAATIAARSDAELRAARLLSGGALGALAGSLSDELAGALALVEAGIDFTDSDDVTAIEPADLHARLAALRDRIRAHLERSVGTEHLEAIPWVVLAGAPNAGKSTLFNALLGRSRAVVSDLPGTTRDVLAEPLAITTAHGPAEVILADAAGADLETSDLDRMMQSAAREATGRADLVLRCVPAGEPYPVPAHGELLVRTKSDLARRADAGAPATQREVRVSALRGEGLDLLRRRIADLLGDRAVSLASEALALRPRHEEALASAKRNLDDAIALIERSLPGRMLLDAELVAATMRAALDDLGSLAGTITPDEVLGRIFSAFCVGK